MLVISGSEDPTADDVMTKLCQRGADVFRADTGDFPQHLGISAAITDRRWQGRLVTREATIRLEEIEAVYYRRPTHFRFPDQMSQPDRLLAAAEARHGMGGTLAALNTFFVNDPSLAARAEYKPLQLRVAADVGLKVPPTLVTNDYPAAVEFAELHGPLICKPFSSMILADCDGQPLITFTNLIDVTAIDPVQFATTTNLLQRWVPKVADCRVAMVGRLPFAAAVMAASPTGHVDWRADYAALTYTAIEVPVEVTTAMIRYLNAFGLHFAAFDFGVDHDGQWWFYEANPNGEYLWIDEDLKLGISTSIADLLLERNGC